MSVLSAACPQSHMYKPDGVCVVRASNLSEEDAQLLSSFVSQLECYDTCSNDDHVFPSVSVLQDQWRQHVRRAAPMLHASLLIV